VLSREVRRRGTGLGFVTPSEARVCGPELIMPADMSSRSDGSPMLMTRGAEVTGAAAAFCGPEAGPPGLAEVPRAKPLEEKGDGVERWGGGGRGAGAGGGTFVRLCRRALCLSVAAGLEGCGGVCGCCVIFLLRERSGGVGAAGGGGLGSFGGGGGGGVGTRLEVEEDVDACSGMETVRG
jgi:hypothetical protein